MTPNPEIVYSGDSVKRAAEVMRQINVGAVPVLDGGVEPFMVEQTHNKEVRL
ncbi:MAG: hypothetical protein R6U50_04300 [Desulfobacterales bacterium]